VAIIIYDFVMYSYPVCLSLFSSKYQSDAYENKPNSKKGKLSIYIVCLFLNQVNGLILKNTFFYLELIAFKMQ
jgi:hypothetical protein